MALSACPLDAGVDWFVMGSNLHGQLGLGSDDGRPYRCTTPQRLSAPNGKPITAVALGDYHSMFIAGV